MVDTELGRHKENCLELYYFPLSQCEEKTKHQINFDFDNFEVIWIVGRL